MTTALVILGVIATIAGLVGCLLPVLLGPPLNWLGLVLLSWAYGWEPFGGTFLLVMAVVAIVATVLDFVVPAAGAKRVGASRQAVSLSVLGMVIGIVFFPPLGMIVGALLGAFVGEHLMTRDVGRSSKAAIGVFLGTMFGIIVKLTASGVMTWYFAAELISRLA